MSKTLRVGVIDLVSKSADHTMWGRLMNANLASIMPQVVAVWCEQEGHEVTFEGKGRHDVCVVPRAVVIVEAMASRLPVVASAVSGIRDLVIPEKNGLLVPAGDSGAPSRLDHKRLRRPGDNRRHNLEGLESAG